jgi:hypothetical protein
MLMRYGAAIIAVLILAFGAVIRCPASCTTKATTSYGGMSGTTSDAGEDSSDRCVAAAGVSRKEHVTQQPIAASTPDTEINPPDDATREGQAVMTKLGATASAITYWVSEADGWHVVTTVDLGLGQDTDAEKQSVVRFSAVLLPGQSQRISVPAPIGERQQVLRIRRLGDRLEVARVFGSSV